MHRPGRFYLTIDVNYKNAANTPLTDISPFSVDHHPRVVAKALEANEEIATVDDARAALEAAGCDNRAIATVLALVPNLSSSP